MEQTYSNTKKTKWKQIDEKKRYQIEILLKQWKKTSEIAELLGYSQRTIQREIARGKVKQLKSNRNFKKNEPDVLEEFVYCADYAQNRHEEAGANKGPGLKIGHDHALVDFIEHKIKDEKWSPEAVIGYIKEKGLTFEVSICIKTLYNYIDRDLFLHITNKDLLFKKNSPKKATHRVRTVALNNRSGQSIDKRPQEANNRSELGHWELDLVIGKQGAIRRSPRPLPRKKYHRALSCLRNFSKFPLPKSSFCPPVFSCGSRRSTCRALLSKRSIPTPECLHNMALHELPKGIHELQKEIYEISERCF